MNTDQTDIAPSPYNKVHLVSTAFFFFPFGVQPEHALFLSSQYSLAKYKKIYYMSFKLVVWDKKKYARVKVLCSKITLLAVKCYIVIRTYTRFW